MKQKELFEEIELDRNRASSSTFVKNMKLPVHRWFRYSAGFSAGWAEREIAKDSIERPAKVFDPFAGSGTTLLSAEAVGVSSIGVESHPFVARVARAKLACHSSPDRYSEFATNILGSARRKRLASTNYPALLTKCYQPEVLIDLDKIRMALDDQREKSSEYELTWLTLVSILRSCSHVGTAQWQYVLPNKTKKNALDPFEAFKAAIKNFKSDMIQCQGMPGDHAKLLEGDARVCEEVPDKFATLVVTSPPYPNNYDYADATRLEMTFMREISGWGDLQDTVRKHLIRSCSQHVPEKSIDLDVVLSMNELDPIRSEISEVCGELAKVRKTKGGKKTYHLMVATYFHDLARVWLALRRVCDSPSRLCFVIGDSAPYGVYVPVVEWMTKLAEAAGFQNDRFEKLRDRNIKWKNRKHRVPLCEGELWIKG